MVEVYGQAPEYYGRGRPKHLFRLAAQPVIDRSLPDLEGLSALTTDVSLLFPAVNANIPLPNLPPCGAFIIRAKYLLWVHWLLLWLWLHKFAGEPHFL
jgi:hypothetical protein